MGQVILLVEDNPQVLDAASVILSSAGYVAIGCRNGAEALDRLRTTEPPLVILCDFQMPVMDGERFRAEMLKVPALARVPLLLISAHVDGPRKAARLNLPFLAKPFDADTLLEAVRAHGGPSEAASAEPAESGGPPRRPIDSSSTSVILAAAMPGGMAH